VTGGGKAADALCFSCRSEILSSGLVRRCRGRECEELARGGRGDGRSDAGQDTFLQADRRSSSAAEEHPRCINLLGRKRV
jgi:hypothetical protein